MVKSRRGWQKRNDFTEKAPMSEERRDATPLYLQYFLK
jgi:hypothetical protein